MSENRVNMITTVLLVIIYISFISLGLPDSILGVSIPAMQNEWGFPLSFAGVISMTVVGSTIISSFTSSLIIKKFGTGKVTFASCFLTAVSLFGFSVSPSYIRLVLFAVPLGLGAGSVDTALNNYVALHYKAHHMNWLHSFWGVGATAGPVLMSFFIASSSSWRSGYSAISLIQISLAAVLLISLPLWKKHRKITESNKSGISIETIPDLCVSDADFSKSENDDFKNKSDNYKKILNNKKEKKILSLPGVKYALLTFLFYCAVEHSVGLWGSSYLVKVKNASAEAGAFWMAFYYGGITAGRFFSGFFSFRFSNKQMIKHGLITAFTGSLFLFFPLPVLITGCAFVLIGLGLSPVFPSMLHETPVRFGRVKSQEIIGLQMGFGYTGSAFLPMLLGLVLQYAGMWLFPVFAAALIFLIFAVSEKIDKVSIKKDL